MMIRAILFGGLLIAAGCDGERFTTAQTNRSDSGSGAPSGSTSASRDASTDEAGAPGVLARISDNLGATSDASTDEAGAPGVGDDSGAGTEVRSSDTDAGRRRGTVSQTCSDSAECETGFCADGFCCDTPCDDICASCGVGGFEGVCTAVDRDLACGEVECPKATSCRSYASENLVQNCAAMGKCAPLACVATDVPSGEACGAGGTCDGAGECKLAGKKSLGETCVAAEECGSEYCANSTGGMVCCESACDGLCQRCSAKGLCEAAPAEDSRCSVSCPASTTCQQYPTAVSRSCAGLGKCVSEADYCGAPTQPSGNSCGLNRSCDGQGSCSCAAQYRECSGICYTTVGNDPTRCESCSPCATKHYMTASCNSGRCEYSCQNPVQCVSGETVCGSWGFESGTENWVAVGARVTGLSTTTAVRKTGSSSLAIAFAKGAGEVTVAVSPCLGDATKFNGALGFDALAQVSGGDASGIRVYVRIYMSGGDVEWGEIVNLTNTWTKYAAQDFYSRVVKYEIVFTVAAIESGALYVDNINLSTK